MGQLRPTAWGAPVFTPRTDAHCPLRFPGQYHDPETGLHYNHHRYYDPETGRYSSSDPLGLLAGPNPYAYVANPLRLTDPLGLSACDRARKIAERTTDKAQSGKVREAPNYHGRLPRDRELAILSNPDAVYHSTGSGGRLIFRQGDDIVITEGPGSRAGQLVTSYGPSGPRGDSGAAIFGGSPSDPGRPITHEMITEGRIPTPDGSTLPPPFKCCLARRRHPMDIELVPGTALPHTPRLPLGNRSLLAGPYTSAYEHERHVLATVGAGNWPDSEDDEFRFDPQTRLLASVFLHIPDADADLADLATAWLSIPVTPATLRCDHPQPRPSAHHYWLAPDASVLLCRYDASSNSPTHRVPLAPSLFAVVSDDHLQGWLLDHPDRHVTTAWEAADPDLPDDGFRAALATYFRLTTPAAVTALEDGDPDILTRLTTLRDTLPLDQGVHTRRAALDHALTDLLDFYA